MKVAAGKSNRRPGIGTLRGAGTEPIMGRGKNKAKQTKVARDLKYGSSGLDLDALMNELHGTTDNRADQDEEQPEDAQPTR